jgi:hypothetical protein
MGGMRLGSGCSRGCSRLKIEVSYVSHSTMTSFRRAKELTENWDFLSYPVHPFMSCIEGFRVESCIKSNLDEESSELD